MGQLKAVENELRMSQPISKRLKQLKVKEKECERLAQNAEDNVAAKRQAAKDAVQAFDLANTARDTALDDRAEVRDQVAQAALEKS